MKKFLLLLAVGLWGVALGQMPELIYYQFNRSGSQVVNHALFPVGNNPASIQGNLSIEQGGFLSSQALGGTGIKAAGNRIQTGWNTRINGSFTLAFWTKNIPVSNRLNYVFGDKQAGEFRCFTNGVAGVGNWLVRGGGLPDLPVKGAAGMTPHMVHIVYDAVSGTYTSYVNGVQNTQVTVDSIPNLTGSGLVVGGYLDNTGLNGKLDEFRWYSRVVDATEIANTWDKDLNILGNCPPFTNFMLDTIMADAALVSWNPGQGNTGYYLEYGPAGFNPGQGNKISGTYPGTTPPYLIAGLQPKTTYDLYFGEFCGNGDSAYLPNPISFTTTRLCPTPSQLQATNVGTGFVSVSWFNAANPPLHHVIWGFSGFDPTMGGQSVSTGGNAYAITGLSPATSYDIYLAADCGSAMGGSDTIGPVSVTTQCAPVTAYPYHEDFEPALPNQPGTLPQCWLVNSASDLSWYINKGATPSSGTGPAVDKTTDSLDGHYMYLESSYAGIASYLYTPEFDLSSLSSPVISFWYHMFGNSMGSLQLQVSINSGQSWLTIADLQGEQQWGYSDAWKQMSIDISTFITPNTRFRFVGNRGGSFTGDLAVDEVVVENGSGCLPPGALFLSSTDSSASIRIIGGSLTYGVEWGDAGFTPGTGCKSIVNGGVVNLNNFSDTNCLPVFTGNKLIDLYVWNECDSVNRIKLTFSTACSGYLAPYSDSFDNNLLFQVPDCWQSLVAGNSISGGAVNTYNFGSPVSAPYHARIYNGAGQSGVDTVALVSPVFEDLFENNKQVRFKAKTDESGAVLYVGSWQNGLFTAVDTLSLSTQYREYVVSIGKSGRYNGVDDQVALMHGQSNSFVNIYIDDFNYEFEPACLPPLSSGFVVTDVSFNSAKLDWGMAGQGQLTRIEWGMPGFVPGFSQQLGAATVTGILNRYTIQNLQPGTVYEAWIRDSCDFDKLSPWVGPVQFTTNCMPAVAPYTENFDGSGWQPGISSSEGDAIPACWSRYPAADGQYKWGVFNAITPSVYTGPAKDHSGNGNYIYTEASSGSTGDSAWLYSPWVDISALNRPALEFYFHRYGIDLPKVILEVRSPGGAWDSLYTLNGQYQQSESDAFQSALARLNQWGDTVQVRFFAVSEGCCAGDMAIDNVSFTEAPSCPVVTGLAAFGRSDTSAFISWDTIGGSGKYQVWLGPAGSFANGIPQGGQFYTLSAASLAIDTLQSSACYQVSIREICAPGDTSAWADPVDFCSLCEAIAAPHYQSFDLLQVDMHGDLGDCWSTANKDLLGYGFRVNQGGTTSGNTGPLGDAGTGSGMYIYTEASSGALGDEAGLYSARLDLSALSSPELRFSYHMYGADIDTLHIDILDDNGWHPDQLTINGPQQLFDSDPWLDTNLSLSTFSGPIQIRFRTYRGASFRGDLALDDIIVADPITCPAPTVLDTMLVTSSSATLTWQGGSQGNYQVAWGKAVASLAGANYALVSTNSLSLSGLDGGSQYGFFVRKICGVGDTSVWVGPFVFYTDCVPLVQAPYYANFEGLGASASATYENCWDTYSPQSLRWESEVSTGTDDNTVSTGPYFDNTVYPAPLGTYMFLESSLAGDWAELISPALNVSGIQNPELVYHFHMYGLDINKLEVYLESYVNGTRFLVDSVVGQKQVTGSMPFWEHRVDLSSIPLTTYRVVFRGYKGASYQGDIAIDDVWIDEAGANSCIEPQAMSVSAVGCDSIGLNWLSTSGQSVVEYGVAGFPAGSGTMIFAANNYTVIRGLSPATDYDVRIANICGTDTSAFKRINGITTLNAPVPVAVGTFTDSIFASKNHSAKYFSFDATQSLNATSYYWDFGNGQTSTDAQVMTFFVYNKTYDVMLVAINGCGTDTTWIKVNVDIDLEETPLSRSMQLYPNPAKDYVNLEFRTAKDGKAVIRLTDVTGKEVLSNRVENINGRYQRQLDISRLPAGIYLVEVDDGEYSATRKLIVVN